MACIVCGADAPRAKVRKGEFEILECAACGLAFWEKRGGDGGADFDPASLYDASYFEGADASHGYDDYGAQEASLRATFRRRLARIPRSGEGARLLDVGAAYGFAVSEASRAGWRAAGLELASAAARRAAAAAGPNVMVGDACALPVGGGSQEVVTLWDVLEHLPDPHAALREVARVLAPGGRLVLTTGDIGSVAARLSGSRWHLYNLPEHLFFYTRDSLRRLLEAHGFEIEALYADTAIYTAGYLVERLRKSVFGRSASGRARWPGAGIRIPLNLFDIVLAQAVRSGGA